MMIKPVIILLFLSSLWCEAYGQAHHGGIKRQVKLLVRTDSITFLIKNREFNVTKGDIIPVYNEANGADSFRVFDFANDGKYEIIYEIDDPYFGFKSYLLACKMVGNKLVPINFLSSKDTFQGVMVMDYLCCIDSKGQLFIHTGNVLTNDMRYAQIDKYVYSIEKGCFVFVGSKLFPDPIKRKNEIIW